MKKVTVEKYIQGKLDETFTVHIAFLSILKAILPASARATLNERGFALQDIITASKLHRPYHAQVEVTEKGIVKNIVIDIV